MWDVHKVQSALPDDLPVCLCAHGLGHQTNGSVFSWGGRRAMVVAMVGDQEGIEKIVTWATLVAVLNSGKPLVM